MTDQEIVDANLNDDKILRKLIHIAKDEPDDVLRTLARVTLQDKAIEIIERLLDQ